MHDRQLYSTPLNHHRILPCSLKYKNINFGLTICYDLRFPEVYSFLGKKNDIIINIANWPSKRIDHWNTLLKARAIENQVIIIGVNRVGVDGNNLTYEESSQVIYPDGQQDIPIKNRSTKNFRNKHR